MGPPDDDARAQDLRLARLRERRNFKARDPSLAFLADQFKRDVAKPYRQLQGVTEAWAALVPEALRTHCRLESLQRGVLTVAVDSPATHFQLDEHLRQGLAVKIAQHSKTTLLRRIKVRIDASLRADPQETHDAAGESAENRWKSGGTNASKPDDSGPTHAAPEDFDPELPR